MKIFLRILTCLVFCLLLSAAASADSVHQVSTPQDLLDMALDPDGAYVLMNDLDMSCTEWKCMDFSGTLDGAGHAILNLTVTTVGPSREIVRDGNLLEYEAALSGMFGRLDHAQISNLRLVNFRACIDTDEPCLLGGFAGFSDGTVLTDCTLSGMLELRACNGMFAIAGALGYGTGTLENCTLDTTLICVDTDALTRDEQFLGGASGAGFFTVKNCAVRLDAYISEHGYVHSGGLIGMLVQYPMGMGTYAELTDNTISGRIRFFEDNTDRRAYCEAEAGEIDRAYGYTISRNDIQGFLREEVRSYDLELRPEECIDSEYEVVIVPPQGDNFGYTRYTCLTCGHTETTCYTLPEQASHK